VYESLHIRPIPTGVFVIDQEGNRVDNTKVQNPIDFLPPYLLLRVLKSGLISTQEVGEVLSVSQTSARELTKEVRTQSDDIPAVPGRSGVPYSALIDALYERRTGESFAQAQKLEKALGLRKRGQRQQPTQLHVVTSNDEAEEAEEVAE